MLAIRNVTGCFGSWIGPFDATWTTRETEICSTFGCNGPWTNTLDGVEFIVEVRATGSGADRGPRSGGA